MMKESRSQSQLVISLVGPVSVAGLQLRKVLQGWDRCGSIDECVYRRVTNQIHRKCRGGGQNEQFNRLQTCYPVAPLVLLHVL